MICEWKMRGADELSQLKARYEFRGGCNGRLASNWLEVLARRGEKQIIWVEGTWRVAPAEISPSSSFK